MSDTEALLGRYIDQIAELSRENEVLREQNFEMNKTCVEQEKENAELRKQCSLLREQRDAWKTEAEHQYGLLRSAIFDEPDYPVTGALDAYAAGRHPVLKAEPPL